MQLAVLKQSDNPKRHKAGSYPPVLLEALRQRRIDLGLTMVELASKIPGDTPGVTVHQSMVSMWERGVVNPTPAKLVGWAEALGLRIVMGLQEAPGEGKL